MIGKTITHYKIIEELGRGGMGVVYKAWDTKLDRHVALKFLPPSLTKSKTDLARFVQEAKAAAALNHPNVCTVHEIHNEGENPFIVMEYIEGRTLREIVKDNIDKGLNLRECVDISIQIAEALDYAHKQGIVHRDIKSENIMVNTFGMLKVMDFGLAKLRGSIKLTKSSSTVGTVAYMSPEHLQGKDVDGRADIFSFGVVLYEMLSGQLPFKGEYESAMMYAILNEEPEPIQKYRSDLSSELLHILNRALEKNPDERYHSVHDMLVDLKRLQRDLDKDSTKSPDATTVSAPDHKARVLKKQPWLIAAVTVIILIFISLYIIIVKDSEEVFLQDLRITRVTAHGKAREAVISPDGKYIVHVMENQGMQSLWLRQVATGSNVQILPPAKVKFIGLTFAHDGNFIYYVARKLNGAIGTLYKLPILGGRPEKIREHVNSAVTLSPDSKQLAFIRFKIKPYTTSLAVITPSDAGETIISNPKHPHQFDYWGLSWSPDGQRIACAQTDPQPGKDPITLVAVTLADGHIKPLTSHRWGAINQITWLDDGSGLIISAADQSTGYFYHLWYVSYPQGNIRQITSEFTNYLSVSLTRDMTTLLTTRSDWRSNIWVAPADKPEQARQITSGQYAGFLGISWSADGRLVHCSKNFQIWMINADGSNHKLLSGDELSNWHPAVSPDGQYIVFQSWRGGAATNRIWRMNLDGGNPVALTEGNWDDYPCVSPNGDWVVYQSQPSGLLTLWKVSINGDNPTQLLDYFSCNPAISADGKWIACFASTESDAQDQYKLFVIPFDGGEPIFHYPVPAEIVGRNNLCWTPDGKGLAYRMRNEGSWNIWIKALDDSSPVQFTYLKHQHIFGFDWSKDGKYLAYAAGVMDDDVVLIRNFK